MRINPEAVAFIERGGRTLRCHTMPMLQSQSVAAHSFGVAWWCYLLRNRDPSANLLMAALNHDIAEHETGDIPSPTKEALGIRLQLDRWEDRLVREAGIPNIHLKEDERRILKLADSLELMQHCVRERRYGNRHEEITEMYCNVSRYASTLIVDEIDSEAFCLVERNWEDVNGR